MRLARGLYKFYHEIQHRRPYLIQAVQTGILMGAGDVISQTFVEKISITKLNFQRTLKFACIGFFWVGPVLRVWYGVLDKYIGSRGKAVAFKKVCIDQLFFAPTFLVTVLVAIGITDGKHWDTIKKDLQPTYFDVLKANYTVWPWVQIVNFSIVPLHYQVLVVQVVAVVWNTYLSWKTHSQRRVLENPLSK